ncbi:MAG TPA: MFS transporter [Planctomycetota bacterium]|jgi:MFS family permease
MEDLLPPKDTPNLSDSVRKADEPSMKAGIRQAWGSALMFGLGECSFGLFAAQLTMPARWFGYLGGVPQLIGPLAQALSANLLDRFGCRKRLVLIPVIVQMLAMVPLALVAVYCLVNGIPTPAAEKSLFARENLLYLCFLASAFLYYVAGHFTNPPWTSLISEVVPSTLRQRYFARSSHNVSFLTLVSQSAVGGALYIAGLQAQEGSRMRMAMWIFALAFALSVAARGYAWVQIRRVQDPLYTATAETQFTFWQFIRRVRESNFVHFVLFTATIGFGANLSGPYFLPYWTYDLKYQTWQWQILSVAGTLSTIITMMFWGRFSERFGNKKTLQYTSIWIGISPLFWLFSCDFYYLVFINMLTGASWAGFGLSAWNYILDAVSAPKRARCMAYFNIINGFAGFTGAMIATWLEPILPARAIGACATTRFYWLLVLSAGFRMLALVLLPTFKELRSVKEFSLRHWIFQITSVRTPLGFVLDYFTNDDDENER